LRLVRERGGLLVSSLLSAGILVIAFFVSGKAVPRTVLLLFVPLLFVALEAWRSLAERLVPIKVRNVVVLGEGRDAQRAAEALASGEIAGYSFLDWKKDLSGMRASGRDVWPPGKESLISPEADDVVFASEAPEDRILLVRIIEERSADRDLELWLLPGLTDILASRAILKSLGDLPLSPVSPRAVGVGARALHRAIDLLLGLPFLLAALPLIALVSCIVVFESRGPAWIRQRRVGLGGKVFGLWKIRTMRANAEDGTGPVFSSKEDPRFTSFGRWLRKTRIDELPQLFHVVSGQMSLIGPRPERPEFVDRFQVEMPAYPLRHLMKPGLTGLAQVMGAYATKPDVKLRYDLGYLFHWSPLLDLIILIRTLSTILKGGGI
jgi:exopolysaccharide biosynthesis polyprenyl glycosylphosphotransferase